MNANYFNELKKAANNLGIDYRVLDTYIFIESGRNLNAVNGQHRGLLQWSNSAAKILGYTSSLQLVTSNTTYSAQMKLVENWVKYLWRTYGKQTAPGFFYLVHFLPFNAKFYNQKNFVLEDGKGNKVKKGHIYYNANSGLDYNNDGAITVSDIDNHVLKKAKALGYNFGTPAPQTAKLNTDNTLKYIGLGFGLLVLLSLTKPAPPKKEPKYIIVKEV